MMPPDGPERDERDETGEWLAVAPPSRRQPPPPPIRSQRDQPAPKRGRLRRLFSRRRGEDQQPAERERSPWAALRPEPLPRPARSAGQIAAPAERERKQKPEREPEREAAPESAAKTEREPEGGRRELEELRAAHARELEDLRERHRRSLEDLSVANERERNLIIARELKDRDEAMERIRDELTEKIDRLATERDVALRRVEALSSIRDTHEEQLGMLRRSLADLEELVSSAGAAVSGARSVAPVEAPDPEPPVKVDDPVWPSDVAAGFSEEMRAVEDKISEIGRRVSEHSTRVRRLAAPPGDRPPTGRS